MRKRKILAAVLSVLGALTLVLAACAPAVTPTPTATPTPAPVAATPTPVAATPVPVAGMPVGYGYSEFGEWGMPLNMPPPQYGGVFRHTSGCQPSWFDSHRDFACGGMYGVTQSTDGIIRFSPYLDVGIVETTYEEKHLAPLLAEKWEVSGDGLVVTFYLRRGVKWHDGKPFTAKDVKYSFDKLLDPKRSVWTGDLAMVDRAEIVDDYTVKVYLKFSASRYFLMVMGMPQLSMQPEHLKEVNPKSPDYGVGTGAFKIKSFTAGIELVTEKNPDYYFKGRPYFDGFVRKYLVDPAGPQAMAAGQVDFADYIVSEATLKIITMATPEITVKYNPRLGAQQQFFINYMRESPVTDVRVRRAMAMTVDRQGACLTQFGSLADRLCNPKAGYFNSAPAGRGLPWSEYEKAWGLNLPIEERVVEAKKLLAEAGYPNGFKTEYVANVTPPDFALAVFDVWKRLINVDVSIRIVPRADYFPTLYRGAFDFSGTATLPFLGAMEQIAGNNFVKGGQSNFGSYTHPEVERLYRELLKERDFDKALSIYHQIERLLIADVANIPLYTYGHVYTFWPYIKPTHFMPPGWMTYYNNVMTVRWFDKNDPTWAKRAR